jgi:predicted dehydrogenase
MIGAGHIARMHARVWGHEATVVAVCSRRREKAERLAAEFSIPVVCDTPDELISRKDVDVVSLATPHDLHHPLAIQAMEAGKHVFCEKPLALNSRQAQEMWECAKAAGVKTAIQSGIRVGFPALRHLRHLIETDEPGPIRYFEGVWGFDWAASPDYPLGWRFLRERAGTGALGDLGVYMIDAGRWLIGEMTGVYADFQTIIPERPVISDRYDFSEVRRMSRENTLPPPEGVAAVENEDICILLTRFVGGAAGVIRASRVHREHSVRIIGDRAIYRWDFQTNRLFRRLHSEEEDTLLVIPDLYPAESIVTRFLNDIRHDSDTAPNFMDGLRVQRIMDAAERSFSQKQWVDVESGEDE